MNFNRRMFLAAASAAGVGLPGLLQAQESSLIVGTWGGDYSELLRRTIDEALMRPQGVDVTHLIGSTDRVTKLQAERQSRRGSMDIACLIDSDMYRMDQLGIMEAIPDGAVPRISAVIPSLAKTFAVPHLYSAFVILYNPAKIPVAPKFFADLWDPKLRGRIGLSDPSFIFNMQVAALAAGGASHDVDLAKKKMMEMRSLEPRLYPSIEGIAAAFNSEEIWIAPMYLARGYSWKTAGVPIEHVVPEEGGIATVFDCGVPRNARNKDAGWKYLDALLDPNAQLEFSKRMGYLPTVKDAVLPEDLARAISLTDEQIEKLVVTDHSKIVDRTAEILDFWTKEFKA